MMIKTFNEEIIRQFTISSFRAIVCLDFLLCPLFPRNTEFTEARGGLPYETGGDARRLA